MTSTLHTMFEHKCNELYEPVHTQTCALIYHIQIHIGFVYCVKAHSHSCAKDKTTFYKHSRQGGGMDLYTSCAALVVQGMDHVVVLTMHV